MVDEQITRLHYAVFVVFRAPIGGFIICLPLHFFLYQHTKKITNKKQMVMKKRNNEHNFNTFTMIYFPPGTRSGALCF